MPSKTKLACGVLVATAILIALGLLVYWLFCSQTDTLIEVGESKEYLMKYGYLKDDGNSSERDVINAMKVFQMEAGLEITGFVSEDTIRMMKLPRCGMAYSNRVEPGPPRWQKKNLTYTIKTYPQSFLTIEEVDQEIRRAFKVWSDYTDLTFRELKGKDYRADIEIRFEIGEHGDGVINEFDGPNHILAHAYYPQSGMVHFDDEEYWTIRTYEGINLFQVAAHEFGHSLGLDHSMNTNALMTAFYSGYQENFQLHNDDISRIQELYGMNNLCQGDVIDTIFTDLAGITYVIKGSQYWEWGSKGVPRDIKMKWAGLPDRIDAAFSHREIGKTYFFSGAKVWRYQGDELDKGYPRAIAERFPRIPSNVDAAFVWPYNNQIYFFKGSQLWMFDYKKFPHVSPKFPENVSSSFWLGVPDSPDAAFTIGSDTFFAKGGLYALFNDKDVGPSFPEAPKNIRDMIGCSPTTNDGNPGAFALNAQKHEKMDDMPNENKCDKTCTMP